MKRFLTALTLTAAIGTASYAAEKVVAEVNGKKITEKDVNRVVQNLPPQFAPLKNDPNFRKRVVEKLVEEELLYQEAVKEGIDRDPEVQEEIERAKRAIVIRTMLERKFGKVSEKEAKEFYEKNKKQLVDQNGKPIPYEEIRPAIIESLKQKKIEQAVKDFVESLKKRSKISIK